MTTDAKPTEMLTVRFNAEEAAEMLQLLESALGETRVELHHTHTPDFRDKVQHREALLRGVAEKLRKAGT